VWWRATLVFLVSFLLISFLTVARADHGPRASQLEGSVLCLDAASVRSAVEREGEAQDEVLERRLEARLLAEMQAVFGSLDLAFETHSSCRGDPAYTRLQVLARYLDPEAYLNFPEESYSYLTILQVGPFEEIAGLGLEEAAPGALHVLFGSALHSEAETAVSIGDQLVSAGEEQIRALARAWWDDNAERYARASGRSLAPLFGSGLATVLALALAWRILSRCR
jgi:hypothetical protein